MTQIVTQAPVFPNKFFGRCRRCRAAVEAQAGFTQKVDGRYVVWCKAHVPAQITTTAVAAADSTARRLNADGSTEAPYEPANLDLFRAFPGARWDRDRKRWTVSLAAGDRARVLELADRLKLDVAPELRQVEQSAQAVSARDSRLYPYQVIGVDWLAKRSAALLGWDMGTGKTPTSLMALPQNAAALVVAPAVVKYNWAAEAAKWRPDLKPVVLSGRGSFRFPQAGEIIICNFDILPAELETPKGAERPALSAEDAALVANAFLIVDEAHRVKNYKTARSKRVTGLSRICKAVWGLTGTPLTNRPGDLFGTLASLGMERQVFRGWRHFCDCFGATKNRWGGMEWGNPAPIVPELLRRVMDRKRKEDVLPDLPPKTISNIVVNGISAPLRKRLDALDEEWGDAVATGELPPFEEFSAVRAALAAERIPALVEMVEDYEEAGVPIVIASAHVAPVEAIGNREGWALITGATPAEKRQEIVTAFQAGGLKGLALTIIAGGVGITLTRASRMIFVDLDWTPANNWQCEDRIARIGQTAQKVEIIRMVSDHPLDRHVHDLLAWKIGMIAGAIEGAINPTLPAVQQATVLAATETDEEYAARLAKMAAETTIPDDAGLRQSRTATLHARNKARVTRALPELTPARVETVRTAFRFMLSVCDGAEARDGQGFNKPDAVVAHWMLSGGLEKPEEVETAYFILSRYHRQLGEAYPTLFKN